MSKMRLFVKYGALFSFTKFCTRTRRSRWLLQILKRTPHHYLRLDHADPNIKLSNFFIHNWARATTASGSGQFLLRGGVCNGKFIFEGIRQISKYFTSFRNPKKILTAKINKNTGAKHTISSFRSLFSTPLDEVTCSALCRALKCTPLFLNVKTHNTPGMKTPIAKNPNINQLLTLAKCSDHWNCARS